MQRLVAYPFLFLLLIWYFPVERYVLDCLSTFFQDRKG
jgi:hypothetical protein